MQSGKITISGTLVGFILLVLIAVSSLLVFWVQREAKVAATLTPESVVEAFRATEFEVYDVQEMHTYSAPLAPGERGISFSVDTSHGTIRAYAILYSSIEEANRVKSSITDFNRLMNNQCGYGFRRGSVILLVATTEEQIVQQFKTIFMSIQKQP